jgi:BASS family bile acid:Na+ symporter
MDVFIPFSIALVMFAMGIGLSWDDFARLLKQPRALLAGVTGQLIALPLVAVALALGLSLETSLALGLILIALCPGGVTSNLASRLAKGDTALSISLTAVSSVAAVFTLPLLLTLAARLFEDNPLTSFTLPLWPTIQQLASLTLLPLALAMTLRFLLPAFALRIETALVWLASLAFALVIAYVWVTQWSQIRHSAELIGGSALLLNLATLVLGGLIGWGLSLGDKKITTLVLEVGIQNSVLAVFVAHSLIKQPQLAIPASVYSVIMVCSALAVIAYRRRGHLAFSQ